jgi:hypothetical protein
MFEAEVLTELLLWRWEHPFKNDREFCENLLGNAATALRHAVAGEQLIDTVPAAETNLIAAIYYVEWCSISSGEADTDGTRRQWLDHVRRSLPSCFCAQSDLPPT